MTDEASAETPEADLEEAESKWDKDLVLDQLGERLETFQLLRHSGGPEADAVLDELGANGPVDRDIILELGAKRPLGRADRFPEAHTLAIRSLEVLDRNGARQVSVPKLGPLTPIAAWLVQLVTRFIVRNYQASAIDAMYNIYARREANCAVDSVERPMLVRARVHAERLRPSFKRNPLGVPTFLLGGAVISGFASVLQGAAASASASAITRIVAALVTLALIAVIAWAVIRGAATASRRVRLTTEKPLKALWETIGRAGNPPKDQSRQFATLAIIALFASFILIPVAGTVWAALTGSGSDPVPECTELEVDGEALELDEAVDGSGCVLSDDSLDIVEEDGDVVGG